MSIKKPVDMYVCTLLANHNLYSQHTTCIKVVEIR